MKIYTSAEQLIGHTPLLALGGFSKEKGLKNPLIAKWEALNPAGSVKDRAAKEMLDQAERDGLLHPGSTIIEPTSGNTGIGLAAIGVPRGYRVILTMPETMSEERKRILKAYGATLVLTDGEKGMAGAIEKANELAKEIPGSVIAGQFTNPANAAAHYKTTGPEIWRDTDGTVDVFVAGVGTGGTITGTGRYLKEQNPAVRIVGVEPETSAVLSGGKPGKHGLQGIGAGFVPEVLDPSLLDEVIPIGDREAFEAGALVARTDGILVGISAGAALSAAVKLASRPGFEDKKIVVLLPDTGDRYLSTEMFQ